MTPAMDIYAIMALPQGIERIAARLAHPYVCHNSLDVDDIQWLLAEVRRLRRQVPQLEGQAGDEAREAENRQLYVEPEAGRDGDGR
jgi:hypothetical protein